jgi:outer membrane protein assembly factor BamD (BamD/ComL family)
MNHVCNLIRSLCLALLISIGIVGLVSCATAKPEDVPTDLSPAKFFQKVQELIDRENYESALVYLGEFAARNKDSQDVAIQDKLMEGEYLIAQIAYKQNRLAEARDLFKALLGKYEGVSEKASSPPQWIRVLCGKMIDIIDKKLPAPQNNSPAVNPAESAPAS